jgi:hypothetical protein
MKHLTSVKVGKIAVKFFLTLCHLTRVMTPRSYVLQTILLPNPLSNNPPFDTCHSSGILIGFFPFLVYKELTQFATGDLSSFYFEISKDKLYTMSKKSQHRKSCQTVLLKILDTLSKAMAPILCHTAEDIFQHSPILQEIKKQGTESIHSQGWFNLVSARKR